jgi:hypothetical protein
MYYTDTELWSEREGDAAPDPGRSGPNAARAGERAPTDRPTDGTARAGTFSQLAGYHGGRPSPRVSAGLGGESGAGWIRFGEGLLRVPVGFGVGSERERLRGGRASNANANANA